MNRSERRRQAAVDAKLGAIETEAIGAIQSIVTASAGMLAMAGLVGALAEARVIDPNKVAAWIDVMASGGVGKDQSPAVVEGIKAQLDGLTHMLRAMATIPPNAGRG